MHHSRQRLPTDLCTRPVVLFRAQIVNAESVITVASLFAFYLIAKMGSAPFNKFINDTADVSTA
jgi:hypothetical protein